MICQLRQRLSLARKILREDLIEIPEGAVLGWAWDDSAAESQGEGPCP